MPFFMKIQQVHVAEPVAVPQAALCHSSSTSSGSLIQKVEVLIIGSS
jgi:hypothetical protein